MTQWPKSMDEEKVIRNFETHLQSEPKPHVPPVPSASPSCTPSDSNSAVIPPTATASSPSTAAPDPNDSDAADVAGPVVSSLPTSALGGRTAAQETVPSGTGSAPAEACRGLDLASRSVQRSDSTDNESPRGTVPSGPRLEQGPTPDPATPWRVEHRGPSEGGTEKQYRRAAGGPEGFWRDPALVQDGCPVAPLVPAQASYKGGRQVCPRPLALRLNRLRAIPFPRFDVSLP